MFDRCDANTMRVVDAAITAARELGHNYIGSEHVLLGFATNREVLPPAVASMLPEPDRIRSAIASMVGEPDRRDADVLRSVGIELDEVRSAVRRTFGDDVMERLGRRRVHQPWQPWRRPSRRCTSLLAGSMGMAPRLKRAFEGARHEADRRDQRSIEPTMLLLAVIDVEDALANRLLEAHHVDLRELRTVLVSSA